MELCGNVNKISGLHCTRFLHHPGPHIATVGPYVATATILGRWPREVQCRVSQSTWPNTDAPDEPCEPLPKRAIALGGLK